MRIHTHKPLVVAALLGLTLAFSGCAGDLAVPDTKPAPNVDITTPEPAPEPEVEPEPEVGSLESPLPVGYVATMLDSLGNEIYEVSVKLIDGNANKAIADANMFNDAPPPGMKYVIVQFTFTSLQDDQPIMPGVEAFSYQLATPDGKVYKSATVVAPGESVSGAPDLYKGQSFTGNEVYLAPEDADTFFITAVGEYFSL